MELKDSIQQTDKGFEGTKTDEKEEEQMKKMELETQSADKENQAHSNEANKKIAQLMKIISQRVKTRFQN